MVCGYVSTCECLCVSVCGLCVLLWVLVSECLCEFVVCSEVYSKCMSCVCVLRNGK